MCACIDKEWAGLHLPALWTQRILHIYEVPVLISSQISKRMAGQFQSGVVGREG